MLYVTVYFSVLSVSVCVCWLVNIEYACMFQRLSLLHSVDGFRDLYITIEKILLLAFHVREHTPSHWILKRKKKIKETFIHQISRIRY